MFEAILIIAMTVLPAVMDESKKMDSEKDKQERLTEKEK